jgi:hypothetical protein
MPYVEQRVRELLDDGESPDTKGELNYAITKLMVGFIQFHGKSYHVISDAIAAAQDAADEMKRRVLGPYEDKQCDRNGDVYQEIL